MLLSILYIIDTTSSAPNGLDVLCIMFLTEIVHKALKCKSSNDDFESTNFAIFEEVVHNFGRSDDDMI